VYVRLILILKRDCDLIKDRRIIDAGIVVDEEISGDEHNRDGNDGHPYLRDHARRNPETAQFGSN